MKLHIEASISKKWLESVNKRNSFYYITQNGLTDVNKNMKLCLRLPDLKYWIHGHLKINFRDFWVTQRNMFHTSI